MWVWCRIVREKVMLEPTFLQGEQISKWCNGAAEDKVLIPNGYVGNPKGSQYIEINLKEADRRINMLLFYVRVYSGYYAGYGNSRLLFITLICLYDMATAGSFS